MTSDTSSALISTQAPDGMHSARQLESTTKSKTISQPLSGISNPIILPKDFVETDLNRFRTDVIGDFEVFQFRRFRKTRRQMNDGTSKKRPRRMIVDRLILHFVLWRWNLSQIRHLRIF